MDDDVLADRIRNILNELTSKNYDEFEAASLEELDKIAPIKREKIELIISHS